MCVLGPQTRESEPAAHQPNSISLSLFLPLLDYWHPWHRQHQNWRNPSRRGCAADWANWFGNDFVRSTGPNIIIWQRPWEFCVRAGLEFWCVTETDCGSRPQQLTSCWWKWNTSSVFLFRGTAFCGQKPSHHGGDSIGTDSVWFFGMSIFGPNHFSYQLPISGPWNVSCSCYLVTVYNYCVSRSITKISTCDRLKKTYLFTKHFAAQDILAVSKILHL